MTEQHPPLNLDSTPFALIDEQQISLAYFIDSLRLHRQLGVFDDVIRRFVIEQLLDQRKISVSDEQVVEFQISFRQVHDLYDEKSVLKWLKQNKLSEDDFWSYCLFETKLAALRNETSAGLIEQRFAQLKSALEQVELYHIIAKNEEIAREIMLLVKEGEDFSALAQTLSIDESSNRNGGYVGLTIRRDLSAEEEGSIFSAKPGQVVGPFKGVSGYHLYQIKSFKSATLDEATRKMLEASIFEEFIGDIMRKHQIKILLSNEAQL